MALSSIESGRTPSAESLNLVRRVTESLMQRGRNCGAEWQNLQRGVAQALVQNGKVAESPVQSGTIFSAWNS